MDNLDTNITHVSDFDELDEMRQSLNDIKNKVDQQGSLNEELVKKTIQGTMKKVHKTIFLYSFVLIVFIPFMVWDFINKHLSWPFIIFTVLMFLASFVAEYFINRMNVKHMTDDLVETARKLSKMKNNRKKQLTIGYSILVVWLPWYIYEMYKFMTPQTSAHSGPTILTFLVIGAAIGGIIGVIICMGYYRKMQRANDEMIEQINELTSEHTPLQ